MPSRGVCLGLYLGADSSDEQLFAAMARILVAFFVLIGDIVNIMLAPEVCSDQRHRASALSATGLTAHVAYDPALASVGCVCHNCEYRPRELANGMWHSKSKYLLFADTIGRHSFHSI